MQEIHESHYARVRSLFSSIQYSRPAVFSVLEGRQPGRVFVDREKDPTAVILISDFCYFGGSPAGLDLQKDVLGLLAHEVMPQKEHLIFLWFSQQWQDALQTALQPCAPTSHEVVTFTLDAARFHALHAGWQRRIPSGFTLQRMDAATVPDWLADAWGSRQNFLANGFGFCLLDDARPDARSGFASNAQPVYLGDRHAETGVGTGDAYRRRGLATAVCCAYIEHCLENNICPAWGCGDNVASERLAAKLGYGDRRSWPLLYLHTPEYLAKKEGKSIG
ncbi:MAG: GNAT family N-acetyltransferase [Anaerolineae bacterium]